MDSIQARTGGGADAGEVVAHAHVEDRVVAARGRRAGPSRFSSRAMSTSMEPGHVLAQALRRAAAPGSIRRCSRRWWRRCRAAGCVRRSLTWTVFSSRMRLPASQASTMFCAIWSCGPAAGPTGLAARRPWKQTEVSRSGEPCQNLRAGRSKTFASPLELAEHPAQQAGERRGDRAPPSQPKGPVRLAVSVPAPSGTAAPSAPISSTSSASSPALRGVAGVRDEQRGLVVGDRPVPPVGPVAVARVGVDRGSPGPGQGDGLVLHLDAEGARKRARKSAPPKLVLPAAGSGAPPRGRRRPRRWGCAGWSRSPRSPWPSPRGLRG